MISDVAKKIKFTYIDLETAVSAQTYKKAQNIFNGGDIKDLEYLPSMAVAYVKGSSNYYEVAVSYKDIYKSDCNCYAGERGNICKHVIALALQILKDAGVEKENITATTLAEAKKIISSAIKKIKPYNGPSKIWFSYQHNLEVAALIIKQVIKELPADKEVAKYLWSLVLKLSKKLSHGGVDDSDGFVGGAIDGIVEKIANIAQKNKEILPLAQKFTKDYTGFGFEGYLKQLLE